MRVFVAGGPNNEMGEPESMAFGLAHVVLVRSIRGLDLAAAPGLGAGLRSPENAAAPRAASVQIEPCRFDLIGYCSGRRRVDQSDFFALQGLQPFAAAQGLQAFAAAQGFFAAHGLQAFAALHGLQALQAALAGWQPAIAGVNAVALIVAMAAAATASFNIPVSPLLDLWGLSSCSEATDFPRPLGISQSRPGSGPA